MTRPSRRRRVALVGGLVAALGLVAAGTRYDDLPAPLGADRPGAAATDHGEDPGAGAEPPSYTFVSAPDLLNADLGDVRSLPTWRPGLPNSWNDADAESLDRLISDIASWSPDAVLVAGDTVRGHWDQDTRDTRLFGPTRTPAQRRAAIRRAADFYYDAWSQRFAAHGLGPDRVFTALGDHEIGDNPWRRGSFALRAVPTFKQAWAQHFTLAADGTPRFALHPPGRRFGDTAYATYLSPRVLLVSLDEFDDTPRGMRLRVAEEQLTWLRGVLAAAPDDATVLVQGHVPVLEPVRTRGSSGLRLEGGADSALWRTLSKHDVDLYLAGEVHAFTATQEQPGDVVQLAHGGLFAWGDTDFVVGRIWDDGRIELDARRMVDEATGAAAEAGLWQTRDPVQAEVHLADHSVSVGTMRIDPDGTITERTGLLAPYLP